MSHGKPSVLTPVLARFGVLALVVTLFFGSAANGQCGPCDPAYPCQTPVCEVTCQSELLAALACYVTSGKTSCSHIRIPLGCTISLTIDNIGIGTDHDGLRLEIAGVLSYAKPGPGATDKIFNLRDCVDVQIDGGDNATGLITSIYDPAVNPNGRAFRLDNATDCTIRDLTIEKFTMAINCEEDASNNLKVIGVHGSQLREYGIWSSGTRVTTTVTDCHFSGTTFHGMRLYTNEMAPTGSTVSGCTSYPLQVAGEEHGTSFWLVEGNNCNVVRVHGSERLRFGPDTGGGSGFGSRLINVFAHDLSSDDHVRLEMGIIGGCFVNMCSNLKVGPSASAIPDEPNRPMDEVDWDDYSGTFQQETGTWNYQDIGPIDYDYCFADIVGVDVDGLAIGLPDRTVDIDDLLAVIGAWGACSDDLCPADVAPTVCGDGTVNIDDPLLVIGSWGACPDTPECGDEPPQSGGEQEAPPQTDADCWDKCWEAHPNGGPAWIACYNGCLQALDELASSGGGGGP